MDTAPPRRPHGVVAEFIPIFRYGPCGIPGADRDYRRARGHWCESGGGVMSDGAGESPTAHDGWIDQTSGGESRPSSIRRSEEHTSELQSLMRISYAVFCLKKKTRKITH